MEKCAHIKQVHFHPAFEAEDEERSRRRLAREEEKKVGRDCTWTTIRALLLLLAGCVACAARSRIATDSHFFFPTQRLLEMAQEGKNLLVSFSWQDSLFPND
jgi:hypothetical protein